MSSPSISVGRELYGILGNIPNSGKVRSAWDAYFTKHKIDACLTKYHTTTDTLPERLSEMFHFDRRAYIIGEGLQEAIVSLLDSSESERVNVVLNVNGVLVGMWVDQPTFAKNIIVL